MKLSEQETEMYWQTIPTGHGNAVSYSELCYAWNCNERTARAILHELSLYDSGDDYILIRSSSGRGFYRTDDKSEIESYKRECLAKGRSIFAPIRKINRVLNANTEQYSFTNNLRVAREAAGYTQDEVVSQLGIDGLDKPLLSKMENGLCLPTEYQLSLIAQIYGISEAELVAADICWDAL